MLNPTLCGTAAKDGAPGLGGGAGRVVALLDPVWVVGGVE